MPGYGVLTDVEDADIRRVAEKGIVVVTTASLLERRKTDNPDLYAAVRDQQKRILARMREAGVTLAVGSDNYDTTSVYEAEYLHGLGIFEPVELLRMWTQHCAQTVFPGRYVGRLADGYEASFIALDGDPLEDFGAYRRIVHRFKEGRTLTVAD